MRTFGAFQTFDCRLFRTASDCQQVTAVLPQHTTVTSLSSFEMTLLDHTLDASQCRKQTRPGSDECQSNWLDESSISSIHLIRTTSEHSPITFNYSLDGDLSDPLKLLSSACRTASNGFQMPLIKKFNLKIFFIASLSLFPIVRLIGAVQSSKQFGDFFKVETGRPTFFVWVRGGGMNSMETFHRKQCML